MSEKTAILEKREPKITFAVLLIICIVSFIPFKSFASPPIASDEWSLIVAPHAFGELRPLNLSNHRPIDMSFYYLLTSIFGLRFEYFFLLNALILFLSGAMVYQLIKRIFPQHTWLASLAAITYLIYPVDYTRIWVMMLYIRFWWLISLVAIWLLMDFVDSGNRWKLGLALSGIVIPLGAYEGQFGVVAIAAFLIAATSKDKPVSRRLVLPGSMIFIGILFYLWRFHIQTTITDIRYYSVGDFQFDPLVLIERYFQGFKIFVSGWLDPILEKLGLSGIQLAIWTMIYVAICISISFLVFQKDSSGTRLQTAHKAPMLKSHFALILIGGAIWIAGYFPIIGLYSPSLNGHASRVNLFAVAGAALILTSLVAILSIAIARSTSQISPLAIAIITPFILAGIFVQLQVNAEYQAAWEIQRNIWQGTFEVVPNIQSEKQLVIIIPGYEKLRPFEALPFSTAWEVDAGAQVLYNNPNIGGYYYYKDAQNSQFEFRKNGISPQGTDRLVGYKRLIFVLYHPHDNTIELVEDIEETLSLPFSVDIYSPHENIIPAQPSTTDFRWLMQ